MIPSDSRLTQLADAASMLLFSGDDHRVADSAVRSLAQLFREITGLHEEAGDLRDSSAIPTASGLAISPLDAGRCLLDSRRTAVYLRGVFAAIQEAQRRFPGEVIRTLYAGCGPFAPLCLPLLPLLAGQPVHFTLLDLHARAIESVQAILAALRLEGADVACQVGDAAHYRVPHDRRPHVVMCEAMQRALEKEPQVAILMNTAPQLIAGGVMFPEMIAVDAVLTDLGGELEGAAPCSSRILLGRILEVDRERVCAWSAAGLWSHLPPVRVEIPAVIPAQYSLVLTTTIRTFGEHCLREYDSGLTHPLMMNGWSAGKEVEFIYRLGERPGFQLRASS